MFHNDRHTRLPSNPSWAAVIIAAVVMPVANAAAADRPPLAATVIEGASAYSPAELFAVYRDQLGRPITSASAQAVVAQIEAMYMRDGYSRPEFRLGDDLTGNGILRIEIFEPQVTQVVFNGDVGPYAHKLEHLAGELRSRVPLRVVELQAILQKMRELPGLTIQPALHRDETRRNSYTLAIDADFKPVDSLVQVTNRGTRAIGPNFAFGQLISNNLFGLEERLGLLFSTATDEEEFHGAGVYFDVPVSERGMHLTATTFSSRSNPTEAPDRNYRYMRERTVLRATQPIDIVAQPELTLSAGIDFDDLEIMREELRLRSERLRVVEIGARLSGRTDGASQYLLAMQARYGLDGLGSQLNARDILYDRRRNDFMAFRLQYTQLFQFAGRWSTRLDVLGQQSAYVLPDAERYKIGGERLGRGFEVTEIAGDQGIGAKVELRRELGALAGTSSKASLYGFSDFGAAWKQDMPGRESAVTAGLGFALEYGHLSGFVELAKPMTRGDVEGERDTKVFATLRLKI